MTIPDRIVVMKRCRIEQIGAPLDPYDRPANQFVAGFIGSPSMNFLNGTITEASFQTSGVVMPLPRSMDTAMGRAAVYGIHPEHFRLTDT
ncbi:Maltose/maltodextrin import ATP-binding protein MalK [compost metagenome]